MKRALLALALALSAFPSFARYCTPNGANYELIVSDQEPVDSTGSGPEGESCIVSHSKGRNVLGAYFEWNVYRSVYRCGGPQSESTTFGESTYGTQTSCNDGCVVQTTKTPYISMQGTGADSYYAAFTHETSGETGANCTNDFVPTDTTQSNNPNQMDSGPCPEGSAYGTINDVEVCVPGGNNAPPGFEPADPADPDNPITPGTTPTNGIAPGAPAPTGTPRPDGTVPTTPGTGNGDPNNPGNGTGDGTGTDFSQMCLDNPDILACKKLASPEGTFDIPKRDQDISIQSGPNWAGGGTCPADVSVNIGGQQVTILATSTMCSLIESYMRPIILLLAAISAAFIVIPKAE
jgi:Neisseria meningitidis TspB protein